MKKIRRLCVVNTVYTLFLYYLILGFDENDIFIFSAGIPESIRKNIKHVYFPPVRYFPITEKNLKERKVNWNRVFYILRLRFILFFKTFNKHIKVYGHGHLAFSFPIYEYEDSSLIEDGLGNYCNLKQPKYDYSLKQRILYFFGNIYTDLHESYGTHKHIKKIYLTKKNVPEVLKHKTEIIDMKELWENKSEDEKEKILEIFNMSGVISQLEDNHILLITQCFYEDRLLPLDEEIKIYKTLIQKQETDKIIIKTHPRENKDYKKYFPNLTVIDTQFPLEILQCMNIKFKKIITVSSTAALHFPEECEIELYDGKTSSDLVNLSINNLNDQINMQKHD